MKTKLLFSLALAILMISCDNQEELTSIVVESREVGTISLSASIKDMIEVSTTSKSSPLDAVLDNLSIEVFDDNGMTVIDDEYRNLPEFIELPVGFYTVVFYTQLDSSARFDQGSYGNEPQISFEVIRDTNTSVPVELRLFDVATTIDFSEDVLNNFPDITAKVIVSNDNDRLLEWSAIDDSRTGYFSMIAYTAGNGGLYSITTGDLTVEITALDTSGNQLMVSRTYPGATANQHYKLLISYAENATVDFDIVLGGEEVIEDEINFPHGDDADGDEAEEDESEEEETSDAIVQGDLIVTEIMNNPDTVSDTNGEWFELYNTTSDKDIPLNGLKVVGASSEFTVNSELIIAPGSYVIFGRNEDIGTNGGVTVDYVYSGFTLTNTTGSIALIMDNIELDQVIFDEFVKEAGRAMQLNQNSLNSVDNDTADNWCLATTALSQGDFGTPGAANEVCN